MGTEAEGFKDGSGDGSWKPGPARIHFRSPPPKPAHLEASPSPPYPPSVPLSRLFLSLGVGVVRHPAHLAGKAEAAWKQDRGKQMPSDAHGSKHLVTKGCDHDPELPLRLPSLGSLDVWLPYWIWSPKRAGIPVGCSPKWHRVWHSLRRPLVKTLV